MLPSHGVFPWKIDYRLGEAKKKIKFGAKSKVFIRHVLSFLYRPQKVSVFRETVWTHIDCRDVCGNFVVVFIWQLELYFLVEGAYAPESRIILEFRKQIINRDYNNTDHKSII
jgi:hypothetical protein